MLIAIAIKRFAKIIKLLKSPYLLIFSIIFGVALGTFYPDSAKSIEFIGDIYVNLLKLCVLPILLSAICISTTHLVSVPNSRGFIPKLIAVVVATQLSVSIIALILGLIVQPGSGISSKTLASLGVQINSSGIDYEVALNSPPKIDTDNPFLNLLSSTVPSNIFASLSESRSLQVVFFAILFGIALGLINGSSSSRLLMALEEIYTSFRMIIKWLTAWLPLGLFSLIAAQIAKTGFATIALMSKFVLLSTIVLVIIYILSVLVLWFRAKTSLGQVLSASKEYSILTMATSNSSAGLPSALYGLTETLKFDEQAVNAVLPVGIIAFRYGVVAYFTLIALFTSQLYGVSLGLNQLALIVVGSIFAALASSGSAGVATLPALDIVFKPLALPLDSVLILLIAIDPVLNPLRATTNISAAMAGSAILANRQETSTTIADHHEPNSGG